MSAATLTNGSATLTLGLLERAGLEGLVGRVVSIDEVRAWKPALDPYWHAAEVLGVVPGQLAWSRCMPGMFTALAGRVW